MNNYPDDYQSFRNTQAGPSDNDITLETIFEDSIAMEDIKVDFESKVKEYLDEAIDEELYDMIDIFDHSLQGDSIIVFNFGFELNNETLIEDIKNHMKSFKYNNLICIEMETAYNDDPQDSAMYDIGLGGASLGETIVDPENTEGLYLAFTSEIHYEVESAKVKRG